MTLQQKKSVIVDFLRRCNRYADERIAAHRAELGSADAWQALAIQDKIGHWTAYRAFNDYTIDELATQELDHWFE